MVFFGFLVIRSGLSQPLNKMVWLLRILCHDIPLLVFAAGAFMQQLIAFFGMLAIVNRSHQAMTSILTITRANIHV